MTNFTDRANRLIEIRYLAVELLHLGCSRVKTLLSLLLNFQSFLFLCMEYFGYLCDNGFKLGLLQFQLTHFQCEPVVMLLRV